MNRRARAQNLPRLPAVLGREDLKFVSAEIILESLTKIVGHEQQDSELRCSVSLGLHGFSFVAERILLVHAKAAGKEERSLQPPRTSRGTVSSAKRIAAS
jgi:hypothetical protein